MIGVQPSLRKDQLHRGGIARNHEYGFVIAWSANLGSC